MTPHRRSLPLRAGLALAGILAASAPAASAAARVVQERLPAGEAGPGFEFRTVPRPSVNDAARTALFQVLGGRSDPVSPGLAPLQDGRLPRNEDAPDQSFFLNAGSPGGRLRVDLGSQIDVAQVNTYSWHAGDRGPQVYTLHAATGSEPGFQPEPDAGEDPARAGWTLLATVDTRPADPGEFGGQYGVSLAAEAPETGLGRFRYLLFTLLPTQTRDRFGHTFYGEIDVIDRKGPPPEAVPLPPVREGMRTVELDGGRTRILVDASETPDLVDWVDREAVPMIRDWYAEIGRMLASDGFEAPRRVTVVLDPGAGGVAATSGTRVVCAADWFRKNLGGEAKGALFHELVHVVQQYRRSGRRNPGWLVEGIADYLRWFRYEPRSGGALIAPAQADRVRPEGSYRITANFLQWVTLEHGPQVLRGLNAALREGRYREDLWQELTGKPLSELGEAWRADLRRQRAG